MHYNENLLINSNFAIRQRDIYEGDTFRNAADLWISYDNLPMAAPEDTFLMSLKRRGKLA